MADMYEHIRRESRKKRMPRHVAYLVMALTIVVVAVAVAVFVWFSGGRGRFYDFVGSLSAATVYTEQEGDGAYRAEVDGETVRVSVENAYGLYTYLAATGQGVELFRTPKGEPAFRLTYADGSVLRAWPYNAKGEAAVRFDGADGLTYLYTSKGVYVDAMVVRYLRLGANQPWEE